MNFESHCLHLRPFWLFENFATMLPVSQFHICRLLHMFAFQATSRRRATKLLDIISKKGQHGFNSFQKSLVETHNHLAILLKEGVSVAGVCWSPGMSPEILTKEEGENEILFDDYECFIPFGQQV